MGRGKQSERQHQQTETEGHSGQHGSPEWSFAPNAADSAPAHGVLPGQACHLSQATEGLLAFDSNGVGGFSVHRVIPDDQGAIIHA